MCVELLFLCDYAIINWVSVKLGSWTGSEHGHAWNIFTLLQFKQCHSRKYVFHLKYIYDLNKLKLFVRWIWKQEWKHTIEYHELRYKLPSCSKVAFTHLFVWHSILSCQKKNSVKNTKCILLEHCILNWLNFNFIQKVSSLIMKIPFNSDKMLI